MRYRPSPQLRKTALGATAFVALAGLNAPAAVGFAERTYHHYKINQPGYKAAYGHWDLLDVPRRFRINAIHAALLHTGKVLLIAGSGNDQRNFNAGRFQSILWDPSDNSFKEIDTPKDMFCSGHAQLPDGKLLVAGGTARYEKLTGDVTRAGGAMIIKNEDPDKPRLFPKGTIFRGTSGNEYHSLFDMLVPRAKKTVTVTRTKTTYKVKVKVKAKTKERGKRKGEKKTRTTTQTRTRIIVKTAVKVTASQARVYVEATVRGEKGISNTADQYEIAGLTGKDKDNLYGLAAKLGLDKKDFQGLREAYEFDPVAEKYIPVDPMAEARWYPTLVTLQDGRVLAVSGLDDMGEIIPGKNEIFDPRTRKWSKAPDRYFPTYPALFLTQGGDLFYSGSNAGYGPAGKGRVPGIWNLKKNTFSEIPGLTQADRTETSASVLLPPAQSQRFMIMGGGGVGESHKSTARTALVDLKAKQPRYQDGPELPEGTRYLNAVLTPDDTVFTTGGSADYRGKKASDILKAQFYDPATNTFSPAAAPTVGRDYHSEALLLPDGRIAVFGSNPLFADKDDTQPGVFEQRIEVFTPPYLYGDRSARPRLAKRTLALARGASAELDAADPAGVAKARLMRPSAVTHATDVEQRSIELAVARKGGSLSVRIPADPALVPSGWYMLFVTNADGTPSKAQWVHIR